MGSTQPKRLLDMVEDALRTIGRPATSKEIAECIAEHPEFGAAPTGLTPHKTVHARIATDIVNSPKKTRFYRFAASTFALKSLSDTYPHAYRHVYIGFNRRRQLQNEPTLHIHKSSLPLTIRSGYYNYLHYPIHLLKTLRLSWLNPRLKRKRNYVPVTSFILLVNDGHVLTFEPSEYDEKHSYLKDSVTIGLHGHFREDDLNLFDKTGVGFNFAIEREVHDFLHKFVGNSHSFDFKPKFLGFVRDDYSQMRTKALGVVACVNVPRFAVDNHRLGYRNLNWRPLGTLPNDFVMFDSWSQYVFAGIDKSDL